MYNVNVKHPRHFVVYYRDISQTLFPKTKIYLLILNNLSLQYFTDLPISDCKTGINIRSFNVCTMQSLMRTALSPRCMARLTVLSIHSVLIDGA